MTDGRQESFEPLEISSPPPSPSNEGWIAWMQVAGSWCLMFNCWGIVNTYGAFQTYYETDLLRGHSPSQIAWIGSIQTFLFLFGGAIAGPLYDHGHFRTLLVVGTFLMVFGMIMVSLCTEYWHFVLAQGITVGIGGACLFVPGIAILPTYFSSHLVFAMGVAGSGSGLGGVLYPIIFQQLVKSVGFGWSTRAMAFIMLTTLLVSIFVMKFRPRPSTVRKLFDKSACKEPSFFLFAIGAFFGFIGVYMPLVYVAINATYHGMHPKLASYLLPTLNAGSVLGRIVPNYAANKTGPMNMFIPTCFLLAALSFAWIGIDNNAGLIIFVTLYGFFCGAFMTLPFSIIAKLSPHLDVAGVRMGMITAAGSFGILIGTPVGGAILHHGGWVALQSFGGAALAICGTAVLASRVYKAGWHVMTKV